MGADHIKAMLTGDTAQDNLSPYLAVSWEETDDTFTALVADNGPDKLKVNVFSHADTGRDIKMRIWQLDEGDYVLRVSTAQGVKVTRVHIKDRGQRIPLTLPPQTLTQVLIETAN